MLTDRYDLPLSTTSAAARDAYVQGCDLLMTLYPGAEEAFDRAITADERFALAHSGKAQVLLREGKVAAARSALAAAMDVAAGVADREASHLAFLELMFAGGACEGVPQPCRASHTLMWEILGGLFIVSLVLAVVVNTVVRWLRNR